MIPIALLLSALAVPGQAGKKPVHVTARVYVFPAEGSSPDRSTDAAGLAQAVRELSDALAHQKGITVVGRQEDADVRVEVTDREERDAGDGGFGGKQFTRLSDVIIRFHARASRDEIDLKGSGLGASRAAKDAAERLTKWIARQPSAPPARSRRASTTLHPTAASAARITRRQPRVGRHDDEAHTRSLEAILLGRSTGRGGRLAGARLG